jgi:inner membrane protein
MIPQFSFSPWLIAAASVLLATAELQCPGCYLIWIAAGGAVTALISFGFDLSLSSQISIFIVSCSISCVFGYFIYQKLITSDGNNLNQRNLEMVGMKGIVTETLENGHGKVKLGDSVWLAEGGNMEIGTPIIVTGVRGTVALVSSINMNIIAK